MNAIKWYRVMRWLYCHKLHFFSKIIQWFILRLYNCAVSGKVQIGKGTYFIRGGISVALHDDAVIGDYCRLGMHLVVVGQGPYKNVARIGNNVWIGPNVTIQGPVIIEDGVIIAPGSVVNKSVPANAIVAGVPAKIIGFTTELNYNIMDNEATKEGYLPFMEDKRVKK